MYVVFSCSKKKQVFFNRGSILNLCLLGSKCSNICSEKQHKGVLGQPISIRCSLSNRTLLQNLAWLKGGKKVIGNCSYNVRLDGHNFVLRIKKLSQDDVGKYTCSGTEKMMGRYFYSTTNLVATEPVKEAKKNCMYALEYIIQRRIQRGRKVFESRSDFKSLIF